jgi:hypothetical protein
MVIDPLIDVIDKTGEGGTLARPRRTRHQNQAAGAHHHLGQHFRQTELFRSEHLIGNLPQHHSDVAPLLEDRNPKAGLVTKGKSKVGGPHLLQLALTTLGCNTLHQGYRVFRLQCLGLQLSHSSMQTKNRRLPDRNMNIAGPLLDAGLQKFVNQNSCHGAFLCKAFLCRALRAGRFLFRGK